MEEFGIQLLANDVGKLFHQSFFVLAADDQVQIVLRRVRKGLFEQAGFAHPPPAHHDRELALAALDVGRDGEQLLELLLAVVELVHVRECELAY